RRTRRDAPARDHAGRGHPQGHRARCPPVLPAGAVAHAGARGAAHLSAPPRRRSPGGLPHRAAPPLGAPRTPPSTLLTYIALLCIKLPGIAGFEPFGRERDSWRSTRT